MEVFGDIENKITKIKKSDDFKKYIEKLKDDFNEDIKEPIPSLDYHSFEIFFNSGSRVEYEKLYLKRRNRLTRSAILFLLFDESCYKDELCKIIWDICGEISWVIPAHLNNIDVEEYRTHIDLFSAETAASLSEILYILGNKLPEKIVRLVKQELKTRIFDAYENKEFWWETLKSNWASVIGGSLAISYMYVNPQGFENVKDRLFGTINSYLKGFNDDGCCIEGISYWNYGFSIFLYFCDIYYHFTNGKTDLKHSEKIDKIALYLQNVIMPNGVTVSFSDGTRKTNGIGPGLISYIVKNYNGAYVPDCKISENISNYNFISSIRNLLWTDFDILENKQKIENSFVYYKDAQWYIKNTDKYSFAAKAGNNEEEHNHNDIGSFIFAVGDKQILVDLGAMEYTKENFDISTRYSLFNNSSLGHSVPIVNNEGQEYGNSYFGTVINANDEEFSLDISKAYKTEIKNIIRTFKMNENGISLRDVFVELGDNVITERFITLSEPEITEKGVILGNVLLSSQNPFEIKTKTIYGHDKNEVKVYIIDYCNVKDDFSISISI